MIQIEDTLDLSFEYNLPSGVPYFLTKQNPVDFWEARGKKGKGDYDHLLDQWESECRKKLTDNIQKYRKDITDFATKSKQFMYEFVEEGFTTPLFEDFLDGDRIFFIIGAPRTGGTYVYTELSRALDWPWKQLLPQFTHDHLPHGKYLRGSINEFGSTGWRQPFNYFQVLFDFCCYFQYINEVHPDRKNFLLKNSSICHGIQLMDQFFGEKAHYLLTTRHPGEMCLSRGENNDEEITDTIRMKNFEMWEAMYLEVMRDGAPTGKLTILPFDDSRRKFLENVFEQQGFNDQPEPFDPKQRSYKREFWNRESISQRIRRIYRLYDLNGYTFPDIVT
ncbi:MAG: hypothetical protein ABEJ65_06035 [bacterium]